MIQILQKKSSIHNIYKIPKIHHSAIKYDDNIYIDTSNKSTIYYFLHSQNTPNYY